MLKYIYTYSLITVLFCNIALPTYISLFKKKCEIALCVNDIEEDLESEESEKTKDLEIKLLFSETSLISYKYIETLKKVIYLSKEYSSVYQKLESPPPKLYT